MVPALQAKLLRFLEEKTFKRVGGAVGYPRRRPGDRRDQPQPAGGSAAGPVPRGPVLPAERAADRAAAAARARRTTFRGSCTFYIDATTPSSRSACAASTPEAMQQLAALSVARQRPRAAQRRRAGDAAGRRRHADGRATSRRRRPVPCVSSDRVELPAGGIDLEQLERSLVVQALERTGWNQTRAAALLGLNRDQIRYRIEKFQLEKSGAA